MKNLFLMIGMSIYLSFSGCASKSGFLSPDVLAQRALSYTKKAEIYNSLEIKASAVVTYLNPLLKAYDDHEHIYMLVSLFVDNDVSNPEKQGLHNSDISLTLDDQRALNIQELKKDDDLIKIAPIQNMWSHYYLVTYAKTSKDKFTIKLKSQRYGSSVVIFEVD